MDAQHVERRRFKRESLKAPLKVYKTGKSACHETVLQDISEGGLCFYTEKFFSRHSRLKLELFTGTPQQYATVFGTVHWIKKIPYRVSYHIGVKFDEICPKIATRFDRKRIEKSFETFPTEPYTLSV
ncbi:MAG: PilZ domain-containing protein [Candidatus Omnitrophica bacterium]|nr:PilZ domain-containing protein [Candidatus Omnitrophota bacterium]